MKILAIDFGEKRVGFAIGDTELGIPTPLNPFKRSKPGSEIEYIKKLISEYEVNKIVLGYPLNMDGTESNFSRRIKNFRKKLAGETDMEIELLDERLTSFEAEEMIKPLKKQLRKKKEILDSIAALVILNEFMVKK
ncbi:MAG: Holliday junction resolvase RuvX [Acidobacteriota bacterium]